MNFIEAAVFVLLLAILSVPLATRFKLPLEIFLVIGSCLISLTPGLPNLAFNPIIVFDIFLPPILFSAAYFTSWRDFKFNFRPIALLAFGLVFFNTLLVALLARYLIPGFTWAEGFLLGAIVSPTDASAATSIIKKLGVPRRLIAILEGESLINDASALVLYRFSLGAIIYGSFSLSQAASKFLIMGTGGLALGLAIGYIAEKTISVIKDVQAETTFTFITAFAAYLLAERLGFSGVISTVTAGLYFGIKFPEVAVTQTRVNAKATWITALFVINGFVFALIGFELPTVLRNLSHYPVLTLAWYGSVISIAVIALRLIWIYPAAYIPRVIWPSITQKDPMPPWQFLFAIGWTGMRGIVSLAAVLAIPKKITGGLAFPHLDLLTFLTYCVVVATLIVPTLTLPSLLRFLHLLEANDKVKEEAVARIRATEGVLKRISDMSEKENIPRNILNEFRNQMNRRLNVIENQINNVPYSALNTEYQAFKKLTTEALRSEKETLLKLRKTGEIHDEVFRNLLEELDIEEIRMKNLRI